MKKLVKSLAVTALLLPSLARAQSGDYSLNGKVGQLSSPAKAYLVYSNSAGRQTDSTSITNGSFSFRGTVDQPALALIVINKNGTGVNTKAALAIKFYLEPVAISINSPDSAENIIVKGGSINADNNRLQSYLKPIEQQMSDLNKVYYATPAEKRKEAGFMADIEKKFNVLEDQKNVIYLDFIKANPNSLISLFTIKNYAGSVPDIAKIEPLFNSLSAGLRSTKAGMAYHTEILKLKKTAIGAIAPDFSMADTAGKMISLHDFKGKYVLVDFWASWCGPCRAENPNVVKAYHNYKDKNFTILGVSLDQPGAKEKWIKAIRTDHLDWDQVSDLQFWKNEAAQLYSVQAIPQNFLIGPDGKIVAKNIRGEELEKTLKTFLN